MTKFDRGMEQWLARWAHNPKVDGSNPSPAIFPGGLAQSVEQRNHNPWVTGSSPVAAITRASSNHRRLHIKFLSKQQNSILRRDVL